MNIRNVIVRRECENSCRKSAGNPWKFEKICLDEVLIEVRNFESFRQDHKAHVDNEDSGCYAGVAKGREIAN